MLHCQPGGGVLREDLRSTAPDISIAGSNLSRRWLLMATVHWISLVMGFIGFYISYMGYIGFIGFLCRLCGYISYVRYIGYVGYLGLPHLVITLTVCYKN